MAKKWTKVKDRVRGGKKTGVIVLNKSTGEQRTLLNSHGKYQKYQYELEKGVKVTNDGQVKRDKQGRPIRLRAGEEAYRHGYRSALIDQAKAYNSRKGGRK